jgi:hypothetical protein
MIEAAFLKFLVVSGFLLTLLIVCVALRLWLTRTEAALQDRRKGFLAYRRRAAIRARNAGRQRAALARCEHAGFAVSETHIEIERGVCSVCGPYVRQTRLDRRPLRWSRA